MMHGRKNIKLAYWGLHYGWQSFVSVGN